MRKKIVGSIVLLFMITGCFPKAETEKKEEAVQVVSGNKGDYSILAPFKTSPLRTSYAEGFREIDVLEIGRRLQEKSKEYFSPDTYFLSEGSVIDATRYQELVTRRSETSPYGLNAERDVSPFEEPIKDAKGVVTGKVVIPNPAFVNDIYEINFLKNKDQTDINGMSLAVILDRYQISDPQTGATHRISDDSLYKVANDVIGVQLEAYLRKVVPGLEKTPIFIAFYVQESIDDKLPGKYVPGHFIGHGYFEADRSSTALNRDDEKWLLLNSNEASTELPEAYSNFMVFKRKLTKFLGDEGIGVVGQSFVNKGKVEQLQIEVNTGSKTQLELYALTQYLSSIMEDLQSQSVPITVNIKLYQNTRAIIKFAPGSNPVTTFIY